MAAFRINRPIFALTHDVAMAALSFGLSIYLRMGDAIAALPAEMLLLGTLLFAGVAAIVFRFMGLYRGIWRYASMNDLIAIFKAVTLAILVFLPLLFLITRLEFLPRSALAINWFVLILLLGAPRFLYRIAKDGSLNNLLRTEQTSRLPVLLFGSGDAAELFIRETSRDRSAAYEVVGIIDDKPQRVGRKIHHVTVMGSLGQLPETVARLKRAGRAPCKLVVARDGLEPDQLGAILDAADAVGLPIARLPRATELRSGVSDQIEIRPIAIEDLLGRPQAVLDRPAMKALIAGRRVLVTGAGGTIGSELVRQIAALEPARLALLDAGEFALYQIDLELAESRPEIDRVAYLGDVRDRARLRQVVSHERPALVFHAAALKHVPMVEHNPNEGILTNVIGTRNIADVCFDGDVELLVLVSTDKAVNPTNVMGATKRLAEAYCQALDVQAAQQDRVRVATVRFGNVLGSTGSVVPLFQRQLAEGGPLTVTHPEMQRYFMTVREAVELVLQASVLASRREDHAGVLPGRIFVLDMGEPVKIVEIGRASCRERV